MLSKLSAELALAESLRSGGDFAELFYEDTRSSSITLMDGKTDKASLSRIHGAASSIRSPCSRKLLTVAPRPTCSQIRRIRAGIFSCSR